MANKYLIVTDPSYILPKDMWDKCWEKASANGMYNNELFSNLVAEALSEFSGAKAWAHGTGFGDWDNVMYGPAIVHDQFCADAGMVCVCQCTDPVSEALKDLPLYCYAMIDVDRAEVKVNFNTKVSDWTVVEIKALDGSGEWFSEYPNDEED